MSAPRFDQAELGAALLDGADTLLTRAGARRVNPEVLGLLPRTAGLVADIGLHEQRGRHWTEVVASPVEKLSVDGGAP